MADLSTGSVIYAPSTAYIVKGILGAGTYGQVALCRNTSNNKVVALKVMKHKGDTVNSRREKDILELLQSQGTKEYNVVHLHNSFNFEGHFCLEFEHLDISLHNFIQRSSRLSLMKIRPILHQLALAMMFLKNHHIIHGDLKPENVMMVNHQSSLQVKVIDFGLAHTECEATPGTEIQSGWYRAPEVFMGSKYDEAVDMWSLGCMAVEMLIGRTLFPGNTKADVVRHIVKTVGLPPEQVLQTGRYTGYYFEQKTFRGASVWKLKPSKDNRKRTLNSLDDLYKRFLISYLSRDIQLDFESFVNLVTRLLDMNPATRITAEEVLEHPFISMSHMVGIFETDYVSQCVEVMRSVTGRPVMQRCVDNEQPSTSSCLQGAPKPGQLQKDKKQESTQTDRADMVILTRMGTPIPKVPLLPVDQTTLPSGSQDSSGSRKRSRDDEGDTAVPHRKAIVVGIACGNIFGNPAPVVSKGSQTVRSNSPKSQGSDSKKRSRDEEKDATQLRPITAPKRRKGTPYHPPADIHASSSSSLQSPTSGSSRKRSREEDRAKDTHKSNSEIKKLRMSPYSESSRGR